MNCRVVFQLVFACLFVTRFIWAASGNAHEQPLGNFDSSSMTGYMISSPDCTQVAWIADSSVVMINGKEVARHDFVSSRSLCFASDAGSVYYWAQIEGGFAIYKVSVGQSPQRVSSIYPGLALVGKTKIPPMRHGSQFVFGTKHVFISTADNVPEEWLAVSPDGRRLVYVIVKDLQASSYEIVVDGRSAGDFQEVWLDSVQFSRDGSRLLWGCKDKIGWRVYVDGKLSSHWENLGRPQFSRDGKHVAYTARKAGKSYLVVDGIDKPAIGDDVGECAIAVGAGGVQITYDTRIEGKWRVIENGKVMGTQYEAAVLGGYYGTTSRLWFLALKEGKYFFIINGVAQEAYDRIWNPVFSPDSKHFAYLAMRDGDKNRIVVVDGREIETDGDPFHPLWLDNKRLRLIHNRGMNLFRIEQEIQK